MTNISNRIFDAKLFATRTLKEGVVEFTFYLPLDFQYSPGQYVWLELINLTVADPKGSRRAFTIVNLPNKENTISIVIHTKNSGYYETLQSLRVGASVRIHGPFGSSFVMKTNQPKYLILIADEIGIPYFLAVIKSLATNQSKGFCCKLFVSVNDESTQWYEEILKSIKREAKCFTYELHKDGFNWDMLDKVPNFNESEWWISGTLDMVQKTFDHLRQHQVPQPDIRFGRFFPSPKGNLTIDIIEKEGESSGLLYAALQSSSNHIVITDANGYILFANEKAQQITGYNFDEMKNNTPRLWGGLMPPSFYENMWRTKQRGLVFEGEFINRRKNGEIYYSIAHVSPLWSDEKQVIGYIAMEEDISNQKSIEEHLRLSEERWKFALEGGQSGVWDWNYQTNQIIFTPRCSQMLGYNEGEIKNNFSEWMKLVHEEDMALVEKNLKEFLDGIIPILQIEYRSKTKDGSWKWILNRGKIVEFTPDHKPQRIVGTMQDMTIEKTAAEAIKIKNIELERMNQMMIGRELKMVELKKEIQTLKEIKPS